MFFLVFVLFTSRWSVRKVLDCFFNMHLCAKLQPYRSNNFAHLLTYYLEADDFASSIHIKHSVVMNPDLLCIVRQHDCL